GPGRPGGRPGGRRGPGRPGPAGRGAGARRRGRGRGDRGPAAGPAAGGPAGGPRGDRAQRRPVSRVLDGVIVPGAPDRTPGTRPTTPAPGSTRGRGRVAPNRTTPRAQQQTFGGQHATCRDR